jgi:hypothetical protein
MAFVWELDMLLLKVLEMLFTVPKVFHMNSRDYMDKVVDKREG